MLEKNQLQNVTKEYKKNCSDKEATILKRVWVRMGNKYPTTWYSMYGDSPIDKTSGELRPQGAEWLQMLSSVSVEAFLFTVDTKLAINYPKFPPSAMEFMVMCQEAGDEDILTEIRNYISDPIGKWWKTNSAYTAYGLCDRFYLNRATTREFDKHVLNAIKKMRELPVLEQYPEKPKLLEEKEPEPINKKKLKSHIKKLKEMLR